MLLTRSRVASGILPLVMPTLVAFVAASGPPTPAAPAADAEPSLPGLSAPSPGNPSPTGRPTSPASSSDDPEGSRALAALWDEVAKDKVRWQQTPNAPVQTSLVPREASASEDAILRPSTVASTCRIDARLP